MDFGNKNRGGFGYFRDKNRGGFIFFEAFYLYIRKKAVILFCHNLTKQQTDIS